MTGLLLSQCCCTPPPDPCGVIYSGTFGYTITALLDWAYTSSVHPYHHLYAITDHSRVVTTASHPDFDDGLTTTRNAFPGCTSSPAPPIQIVGNYTAARVFRFYRYQNDCSPVTVPTQLIQVNNVGTGTIYVNGQPVAPGCSWVANAIESAGYGGGVFVSYSLDPSHGTSVTVSNTP